ncbi:MAG: hypothetical protein KGQ95_01510 [Acidobacteria bacterium]|nr:hypothetical protein [Acidobacteriota bacterium]
MNRTLATVAAAAALISLPAIGAAHDGARPAAGPAPATAPAPPPFQAASSRTAGGQIYVDGAGDVRLAGNLLAFGDVSGMQVSITDRAGDARVIAGGRPLLRPQARGGAPAGRRGAAPRRLSFTPAAREMFSLEGRDLVASFRGDGNVTLSITGTGTVRLDGVGTFRANSQPAQTWPLRPVVLPLRQTPRPERG